jgi:hemolysin activation/secretion protein
MPLECYPLSSPARSRRSRAVLRHGRCHLSCWSCFVLLATGVPVLAQPQVPARSSASDAVPTPAVPVTFEIRRFQVQGGTVLTPEQISAILRDVTGPQVTLPALRRGLERLQEAYRERGLTGVTVSLPRQVMTEGVVQLIVGGAPARSNPETRSPEAIPTYELKHFEVRGNTVLTPEELDGHLNPLAGRPVTRTEVEAALSAVREAYRSRGYTRAAVNLPQQILTEGTVVIEVQEGQSRESEVAALAARTQAIPPPPVAPPRQFEVRRYDVLGNTLLKPELISQIFTNATGTNISFPVIQKALGDLQLAYRERGYATVSVGLPQQQLTNAVVKVQVTEGLLADVRVTGNRYFSSNNILRALPSLSTNAPLNSRVFQGELDIANRNRDRQIYPTIGPGPEPGTSALTLRVKDRLPLHGRLEVNNQSTPGTPDWRINSSLSYANLWQREHQVGLSYGFTPEAFKSDGLVSDRLFNRPLIANYGAYYRLPFGSPESLEDRIASSSGRFGYDEATRQFRLPPAGSQPDITFFGSSSSSDTGVKYGPRTLVTTNGSPLLTIESQDSGQNLTLNDGAGTRVSLPLWVRDGRRVGLSSGLDVKRYFLESFNTNNFVITSVITNNLGSQTNLILKSSPQPARRDEVVYLPLSANLDYFQADLSGTLAASLGLGGNFVGSREDFVSASYSDRARPGYFKATLAITRDQRLFDDWSLLLRANGQVATAPLISNEQFALGGLGSVRGYYEGDGYGDMGWFSSLELRTPLLAAQVPVGSTPTAAWLRGSVFFDAGQRFYVDAPANGDPYATLLGTGLGLSGNLNNHVDLRIAVGWPLRDSANTRAYEPRAYFTLGGQF